MNYTLHLGLHKTGTTFLQNTLKDNRSLLSNHLLFIPLSQSRNNITPYLSGREGLDYSIPKNFIKKINTEAQTLNVSDIILSEENFMGFPIQIKSSLYENSQLRLSQLKNLISNESSSVTKIILSLREYSSFFESLFLEANKRRMIPIESINTAKLKQFSYFELIKDIKNIFPEVEVDIVTYESFKEENLLLFEAVTGLSNTDVLNKLEFSSERRVSPSIEAYYDSLKIYALNDISDNAKEFIHKKLMQSDIYPKKHKSNILFSEKDCVILREKYKQDLEFISGLVDNLL